MERLALIGAIIGWALPAVADLDSLFPARDSRVSLAVAATEGDYYSIGPSLEIGLTPYWLGIVRADWTQLEPGVRSRNLSLGASWVWDDGEWVVIGRHYKQDTINGWEIRGILNIDSLSSMGWDRGSLSLTGGLLTIPGNQRSLRRWETGMGLSWQWSPKWYVSGAFTYWTFTPPLTEDPSLPVALGVPPGDLVVVLTQWLKLYAEARVGRLFETWDLALSYGWARTAVLTSTLHQLNLSSGVALNSSLSFESSLGYSQSAEVAEDSAASLALSVHYTW